MNPLVELEGLCLKFSLEDLGTMLLSFKHETTSDLTSLNTAFNQFRLELQGEMKLVRDEMVEQKKLFRPCLGGGRSLKSRDDGTKG